MKKTIERCAGIAATVRAGVSACNERLVALMCRARTRLADEKGQGTTEYAILVGVHPSG